MFLSQSPQNAYPFYPRGPRPSVATREFPPNTRPIERPHFDPVMISSSHRKLRREIHLAQLAHSSNFSSNLASRLLAANCGVQTPMNRSSHSSSSWESNSISSNTLGI